MTRAIKSVKALGSGFSIISAGTKQSRHLCAHPNDDAIGPKRMVQSVPRELNTDHYAILSLLQVRP